MIYPNSQNTGKPPVVNYDSGVVSNSVISVQNASNSPTPTFTKNTPPIVVPVYGNVVSNIADTLPASVLSQESGYAPFDTLFNDLQLKADVGYNFWVPDEETNEQGRGTQKIEEMPRYVHLQWNPAPDLPDPMKFKQNSLKGSSKGIRNSTSTPSSQGSESIVGSNVNGVQWTPPSLQPDGFEQNCAMAANGYISAGIIEAVVTVDMNTVTVSQTPTANVLDEDDYLAHAENESLEGITFSEINAAMWRWKSRAYASQKQLNDNVSAAAQTTKQNLFNNQFSISPTSMQSLDLKAVSVGGPALSLNTATAQSVTPQAPPRPQQILSELGIYTTPSQSGSASTTHAVRTKFIHTNMQGLLDPTRVNSANSAEHAESIMAIAPFASNLAVYAAAGFQEEQRSLTIPIQPAPSGLKQLEYIGYVIEKYEQAGGSFELAETIYVPGIEYTEFYDTKVKYGVPYRYRIKTFARWCRDRKIGVFGADAQVNSSMTTLNAIAPNNVSYFSSEWGYEWANAMVIDQSPPLPPDEFTVTPHSDTGTVEITLKMPYNPQQDISKITIWRKVQDENGVDQTGWVQIQELDSRLRQGTLSAASRKFGRRQDYLTGDATDQTHPSPFVEFAPINSRFVDTTLPYFGNGNRFMFVYAGICHSRHGEISKLSDQLATRLNQHWKKDGEYTVKFVSCAGVDKDFDTGVFVTYPERHMMSEITTPVGFDLILSAQERTSQRPLNNNAYVARIESLDTGQYEDVQININVTNTPAASTQQTMPVLTNGSVS